MYTSNASFPTSRPPLLLTLELSHNSPCFLLSAAANQVQLSHRLSYDWLISVMAELQFEMTDLDHQSNGHHHLDNDDDMDIQPLFDYLMKDNSSNHIINHAKTDNVNK